MKVDDQQAFRKALEAGDKHAISHAVVYYPQSMEVTKPSIREEAQAMVDMLEKPFDFNSAYETQEALENLKAALARA